MNEYIIEAHLELHRQIMEFVKSKAQGEVAKMLRLKGGTSVTEVKRLLTFSGRPVILDHIIIPTNTFKGITATKIQEKNGSMYSMYESQFGVRMIRAEERLTAVGAEGEVAKALGLPSREPVLSIERVSFTYGDKPMEWRLGLCVTDNHHYMNELE